MLLVVGPDGPARAQLSAYFAQVLQVDAAEDTLHYDAALAPLAVPGGVEVRRILNNAGPHRELDPACANVGGVITGPP